MYSDEEVAVVIRFHDMDKIHYLKRALFSVSCQDGICVRPVIVLQNFGEEHVREIRFLAERYLWSSDQISPAVTSVPAEGKLDIRSRLLNVGIAATNARYVAFLDHDDVVHGDAYRWLVDRLLASEAAIAFGGVRSKSVAPFADFDYAMDVHEFDGGPYSKWRLFLENFCPIHSFVIDRSRVAPKDLVFREDLDRLEDYDLLMRLVARYGCIFANGERIVADYYMRNDGTNTVILSDSSSQTENQRSWVEARAKIERLRQELEVRVSAADMRDIYKSVTR